MAVQEGAERRHKMTSCSALARKRRKSKLNMKQHREDDDDEEVSSAAGSKRAKTTALEETKSDGRTNCGTDGDKPKLPHITGIKKQSRYDPGVPMTKEELVAWRKEARRVRNRESAAASRRKTKEKIDDLQEQLDYLQSKYDAAMERILGLEATNASLSAEKKALQQQLSAPAPFNSIDEVGQTSSIVSPCPSSTSSPQTYPVNIPSSREMSTFLLSSTLGEGCSDNQQIFQVVETSNQRVNEMIRPQAAKIPGAGSKSTTSNKADCHYPPKYVEYSSSTASEDLSSDGSSHDQEEEIPEATPDDPELHEFLLDALVDFDPENVDTFMNDLCE